VGQLDGGAARHHVGLALFEHRELPRVESRLVRRLSDWRPLVASPVAAHLHAVAIPTPQSKREQTIQKAQKHSNIQNMHGKSPNKATGHEHAVFFSLFVHRLNAQTNK
jgi:hypothetical protein